MVVRDSTRDDKRRSRYAYTYVTLTSDVTLSRILCKRNLNALMAALIVQTRAADFFTSLYHYMD